MQEHRALTAFEILRHKVHRSTVPLAHAAYMRYNRFHTDGPVVVKHRNAGI